MKNSGLRYWFFRCLLLILAFAQLVACSNSSNNQTFTALIVYDNSVDAGEEQTALTTLNTLMTDVGYTNVTTNIGIPSGDLSGYGQIWDIRYNVPLTTSDATSYETYLQGGGTLVLTGQYSTPPNNRDDSIVNSIKLFGGSGISTLTLTTPNYQQTVQSYFQGPYPVTDVAYPDQATLDGTTTTGTGAYITEDTNGYVSAIYFGPGMLTNATAGTLMVVFDTNFLSPSSTDVTDLESLTANILYLY